MDPTTSPSSSTLRPRSLATMTAAPVITPAIATPASRRNSRSRRLQFGSRSKSDLPLGRSSNAQMNHLPTKKLTDLRRSIIMEYLAQRPHPFATDLTGPGSLREIIDRLRKRHWTTGCCNEDDVRYWLGMPDFEQGIQDAAQTSSGGVLKDHVGSERVKDQSGAEGAMEDRTRAGGIMKDKDGSGGVVMEERPNLLPPPEESGEDPEEHGALRALIEMVVRETVKAMNSFYSQGQLAANRGSVMNAPPRDLAEPSDGNCTPRETSSSDGTWLHILPYTVPVSVTFQPLWPEEVVQGNLGEKEKGTDHPMVKVEVPKMDDVQ